MLKGKSDIPLQQAISINTVVFSLDLSINDPAAQERFAATGISTFSMHQKPLPQSNNGFDIQQYLMEPLYTETSIGVRFSGSIRMPFGPLTVIAFSNGVSASFHFFSAIPDIQALSMTRNERFGYRSSFPALFLNADANISWAPNGTSTFGAIQILSLSY